MLSIIGTIVVVGGLAVAVPYLLLRSHGRTQIVAAYAAGFLASSAASAGWLLLTSAISQASAGDTDHVLGPGFLCSVIGPVLGVLAHKHVRRRLRKA